MDEPLRHRQTKGAETDMPGLPPPRHIPTLPFAAVAARLGQRRGRVKRGQNHEKIAARKRTRHSRHTRGPLEPNRAGQRWLGCEPALAPYESIDELRRSECGWIKPGGCRFLGERSASAKAENGRRSSVSTSGSCRWDGEACSAAEQSMSIGPPPRTAVSNAIMVKVGAAASDNQSAAPRRPAGAGRLRSWR